MNHSTYKKTLPAVSLAIVATLALLITMTLPSFARAANEESRSPVLEIVERFFEARDTNSSSSVMDILPPGLLDRFFDDGDKPGVGNDTTDPKITDIESETDEDSADISWQTDEKTRGTVYLSTETPVDPDDDQTIQVNTHRRWSTDHEVSVDDLETDTTYYAFIEAKDKAGNSTDSDEFTLVTDEEEDENDDEDTQAPTITNIDATSTATTIEVMWDTDEEADSKLFLSSTTPVDIEDEDTIEVSDPSLVDEHMLTATDLDPDTTYYGIVQSTDADDNVATSSEFEIDTQAEADTDAPILSDITFDTSTSTIDISWTTNEPATGAVYTSTSSGFALDDDGVMVASDETLTTTHDLSVTELDESMTYYHRLVSKDAEDNQTISTQFTISTD